MKLIPTFDLDGGDQYAAEEVAFGATIVGGLLTSGASEVGVLETALDAAGPEAAVAGADVLPAAETFEAIGSTGRIGEQALQQLGGESQVYFRTSQGGRFVDQLVDGVAHESKVGYQSLTSTISRQIAKDAELIRTGQVNGYTWHFFESPVTGVGGPSGPLLEQLQQVGIDVILHF